MSGHGRHAGERPPRRRRGAALALLVALAASVSLSAGCAQRLNRDIAVAGRVRAEEVAVTAPLTLSPPETAAGPADTSSAPGGAVSGGGGTPSSGPSAASAGPRVAGRVVRVFVRPGERVKAGDQVAEFDATLLRIDLEQAQAQLAEARAQRRVLDEKLSDVSSTRSDLRSKRAEIVSGLSRVAGTRRQLQAQLEQARGMQAQMERQRAGAGARGGAPAGGAPGQGPGAPGAGAPGAAPPDPRVIVGRLQAALAQLDAREAQARAGLARIDAARDKLAEADRTLRDVSDVAAIAVSAREVGVELAGARLSLATLRAPEDGLVLSSADTGTVVFANAPVATLRPDRPARVDTYLTAAQLRRVRLGDRATVRIDSLPGEAFGARVTDVGSSYEFVPTTFPTSIVHLSRAFRVTVTLDEGDLPPGTPADVTIGEDR